MRILTNIKNRFRLNLIEFGKRLLLMLLMLSISPFLQAGGNSITESGQQGTVDLESKVIKIFEQNCARSGCHVGTTPMMGLKLTADEFYARTVNQPSTEMPELMRVKPGEPDSSYLVMKVLGTADIIGGRMPFGRDPLSDEEISTIVQWVESIQEVDTERIQESEPDPLLPFHGWKVLNTPTSRMVDKGDFLFLISHRFIPPVKAGYEAFWGLDGSGIIFLNLGYAISNRLFVNLGRSNSQDELELDIKFGLKRQYPGDKLPFAASVMGFLGWITETRGDEDAFRSEAFRPGLQLSLSSQLVKGASLNVVPGILFNPSSELDGEDPVVTLGLAGKIHIWKSISIIGEWVPILSGYTPTFTSGELNRFDTWGAGIELGVGGHAFQIIVTNSAGLTTPQYLNGGSLDTGDDGVRLGFNIFRPL